MKLWQEKRRQIWRTKAINKTPYWGTMYVNNLNQWDIQCAQWVASFPFWSPVGSMEDDGGSWTVSSKNWANISQPQSTHVGLYLGVFFFTSYLDCAISMKWLIIPVVRRLQLTPRIGTSLWLLWNEWQNCRGTNKRRCWALQMSITTSCRLPYVAMTAPSEFEDWCFYAQDLRPAAAALGTSSGPTEGVSSHLSQMFLHEYSPAPPPPTNNNTNNNNNTF